MPEPITITVHGQPAPQPKGIQVTVTDLDTGETSTETIWDDYVTVCAGSCYLAGVQAYANGTHVLTVKGRKTL